MRYVLTACPLINCRSLVNNLANPTRGYRPGELLKPCAARVSLPEGGGFCPPTRFCASQVDQTEWIEVNYGLAEATPPSPRGSAAKDSAQGLPKACLRQALRRRFPPLCIWLQELVLSLVPRALCVLHGCIAVLSCMCHISPCVRVALLRWGPGFRSEPRRATVLAA